MNTQELFTRIGKVIDDRRCAEFEITGMKYMEATVKLIYDDCDEILTFKWTTDGWIKKEQFYTEDKY